MGFNGTNYVFFVVIDVLIVVDLFLRRFRFIEELVEILQTGRFFPGLVISNFGHAGKSN